MPASNLKLLTTAAAMDVLGPQYRFATQLLSSGVQQGERLSGNLYLRGLGDPTLQFADYQALAAQLATWCSMTPGLTPAPARTGWRPTASAPTRSPVACSAYPERPRR